MKLQNRRNPRRIKLGRVLDRVPQHEYEMCVRVADAIENEICMYASRDVHFLPLFDVLRLVNQRPEALSILHWPDGKEFELVYTTYQDRETGPYFRNNCFSRTSALEKALCIPLKCGRSEYWLAVHTYHTTQHRLEFRQVGAPLLRAAIRVLRSRTSGNEILSTVAKYLHDQGPTNTFKGQQDTAAKNAFDRSEQPALDQIRKRVVEALRSVIEDALAGNSHDGLLIKGRAPFRNLFIGPRFAIHNWRRGTFDYTSQMIVPAAQQQGIKDSFFDKPSERSQISVQSKTLDQMLRDLENPFGPNARAIVDSCFCSGTVEFARERPGQERDSLWPFSGTLGTFVPPADESKDNGDEADSARRDAEERIYTQIYSQLDSDRLFCVPIHVGGVAYMAAITFAPRGGATNAAARIYPYQFYNIVPLIGARLRLGVRKAYLKMIADELRSCVTRFAGNTAIVETNKAWRRLAAHFPYFMPKLCAVETEGADSIYIPGTGLVEIHLLENPNSCYADALDFDRLIEGEVVEVCREVAGQKRQYDLEKSLVETTTAVHEMSNLVVPPHSYLQRVLARGDLDAGSKSLVEHAMQWLTMMATSARTRYRIGELRRANISGKEQRIAVLDSLDDRYARSIIETVLQYLLASWSLELWGAGDDSNAVELLYAAPDGLKLDALGAFNRLKDLVGQLPSASTSTRYRSDDLKVLFADAVLWPMALLRELVQNIRLDYPIAGNCDRRIDFTYRWRNNLRSPDPLILETEQKQFQRCKFPPSMRSQLPDGIAKANIVYGQEGAKFGEVVLDSLDQRIVEPGKYKINYRLSVIFFRGGKMDVSAPVTRNERRR